MFICRIVHAKEDYVVAVDVQLRTITPTGDILHTDFEFGGKMFFDRTSISAYTNLEEAQELPNEDLYRKKLVNHYSNGVAESKRDKFKLINIKDEYVKQNNKSNINT